jgi:hypothetical protein
MKVTYDGPQPEVEVPLPDGQVVVAGRGKPAEFPAEIAKYLLEQEDIWKAPSGGKTKEEK